jgi:hypothetical protein
MSTDMQLAEILRDIGDLTEEDMDFLRAVQDPDVRQAVKEILSTALSKSA